MPAQHNLKTIHSLNHIFSKALPHELEAGCRWYNEANQFAKQISYASGYSLNIVCRVVAILSPACNWETNKKDAARLIYACRDYIRGEAPPPHDVPVSTYGQNKRKAIDLLLHGIDTLSGQKVTSFFYNIYKPDDTNYVTIDRHAIKAAIGKQTHKGGSVSITKRQYEAAGKLYKRLAKKHNLKPNEAQAIVWLVYKRLNNV